MGGELTSQSPDTPVTSPKKVILIAVMGATGAGKSTFINTTAGSNLVVGDSLESETKDIAIAEFDYRNHRIVLIDTPGFDDTNLSNTDILQTIAGWLEFAHEKGSRLNGLLYLHRITDNRVSGMSYRNMNLFYKLCGANAMKNVVLCTTMWNMVDATKGESRERELLSKFWNAMTEEGATSARHDGTRISSLEIMDRLLDLPPITLDIQAALAEGVPLLETAAGKEINKELLAMQAKYVREIQVLKQEMEKALEEQNFKAHKMLMEERQRSEAKLAEKQKEQEKLSSTFMSDIALLKETVAALKLTVGTLKVTVGTLKESVGQSGCVIA
ncbi:hypothetical protein FRC03_011572 [Tulasnella sp. 419]|nr:hypothetical protein FRC03_011572 [Tulasnella sp. 419]